MRRQLGKTTESGVYKLIKALLRFFLERVLLDERKSTKTVEGG